MNSNHNLIERLLNNRRSRVELQPGVFAIVQRPAEGELIEFGRAVQSTGDVRHLLRWVVGWEGVTEGVLLDDGSSSPVAWSQAVAELAFVDRLDWATAVVQELHRLIDQYRQRKQAAVGKPSESSTLPSTASGATTTAPSPDLSTS